MNIGGTPVDDEGVFTIAEAGVNHNGEVDLAEELINVAAEAGANAVKFQTFSADRLVTKDAAKARYQEQRTADGESQFQMLRRLEMGEDEHRRLQSHARDRGIAFLSTPFDMESADLLDDLDAPAFKIGSGDLTNTPLLGHVAEFGRPMIVSTGMATMDEIVSAERAIREANPDVDRAYLHCTSAYPTPTEHVNLRAMATMREQLSRPVGYSDHTIAIEMPGFAVAAGAVIVEKHFTTDRSLPGPDHDASLEPDELRESIRLAREAVTARGSPEKAPTIDAENRATVRKSLHAARRISAGDRFTEVNVSIKRPANGLAPDEFDSVIGERSTEDLETGDPITADALAGGTQ